ncbi:MAG: hypothetical protein ACRDOD_23555 [Streptosporangiaceae bacterium]
MLDPQARRVRQELAVAVLVSAATWRVFNWATVAEAYAEPVLSGTGR